MKIIVLAATIALVAGSAASAQDMHYQANRNAARVDSYSSRAPARSRQDRSRATLLAAQMRGYQRVLYPAGSFAPPPPPFYGCGPVTSGYSRSTELSATTNGAGC